MPRLIDAHSARVSIRAVSDCIVLSCDWLNGYKAGLDAAVAAIDEIPTIEAEPVMHGRWKYNVRHCDLECSLCGEVSRRSNYCPNCGAKMDGGADHD